MELILWRHAEAEDGLPDDRRALTPRGRRQAQKMARWLREHLPEGFAVVCSPAVRARQTADALGVDCAVDPRLAPGVEAASYLAVAGWPKGAGAAGGAVVLVGHQPTIGCVASRLLAGREIAWSVKKGAIWWIAARDRDGDRQAVLRTVLAPDLL